MHTAQSFLDQRKSSIIFVFNFKLYIIYTSIMSVIITTIILSTRPYQSVAKNIARVQNCPDATIWGHMPIVLRAHNICLLSFCLFIFLSFCLFVILRFYVFVFFVMLSFYLVVFFTFVLSSVFFVFYVVLTFCFFVFRPFVCWSFCL